MIFDALTDLRLDLICNCFVNFGCWLVNLVFSIGLLYLLCVFVIQRLDLFRLPPLVECQFFLVEFYVLL